MALTVTFTLNPAARRPLYLQVTQQVQHAIEIGALQNGELMPTIRTLAEDLVVNHSTIEKAYAELEHQGWLTPIQGSGFYVSTDKRVRERTKKVLCAQDQVREFVTSLRKDGFADDEISRSVEVELFYRSPAKRR